MAVFINIIVQGKRIGPERPHASKSNLGTVYFTSRNKGNDSDMMQLFSAALWSQTKGIVQLLVATTRNCLHQGLDTTFDVLYALFPDDWLQQDDAVRPFDALRYTDAGRHIRLESIWTFDLDRYILRLDKSGFHGEVGISYVCELGLEKSDFTPYTQPACFEGSVLPRNTFAFLRPNTKLLDQGLLKRRKALLSKMLEDFVFQWRHVLCGPYNDVVFRKFAYAMVRLATLDFTVREIDQPRPGSRRRLVRLQDLPSWRMSDNHVIRVGRVSIIISQNPPHALTLARADFRKRVVQRGGQREPGPSHTCGGYVLISRHTVSHVRFSEWLDRDFTPPCPLTATYEEFSKPERLLNRTWSISAGAVDLLLQATQMPIRACRLKTCLATELQDMVLDDAAKGSLQSAKLGCQLNIGAPFNWLCDHGNVERQEVNGQRLPGAPVESQIWFDDCFSGLAYK